MRGVPRSTAVLGGLVLGVCLAAGCARPRPPEPPKVCSVLLMRDPIPLVKGRYSVRLPTELHLTAEPIDFSDAAEVDALAQVPCRVSSMVGALNLFVDGTETQEALLRRAVMSVSSNHVQVGDLTTRGSDVSGWYSHDAQALRGVARKGWIVVAVDAEVAYWLALETDAEHWDRIGWQLQESVQSFQRAAP